MLYNHSTKTKFFMRNGLTTIHSPIGWFPFEGSIQYSVIILLCLLGYSFYINSEDLAISTGLWFAVYMAYGVYAFILEKLRTWWFKRRLSSGIISFLELKKF